MNSPDELLKQVFGYESFRPMQREVVESVLARRDTFVLMPTGGGKSLCYQVPALLFDGVSIVVSPLISLMKDQVDALRANGVSAAFLNSTLKPEESQQVLRDLQAGAVKLLYVAPERALTEEFLRLADKATVAMVAIDEAHCVSQWGHDFRPEYVELGRLRDLWPSAVFVALTATADAQTREDVLLRLRLREPRVFVSGFDRPNIRYRVEQKVKPQAQLQEFVRAHSGESGIVYCLSRKRVEEVAADLRKSGIRADAYHAGMSPSDRANVQDAFQRDDVDVVVATVAFGMGIDKPDVRFVVHYDMPKNVEGYYQETGRAGRDGLPSEALLLYGLSDAAFARRLIMLGENEEQKRIEIRKLQSMIDMAEAVTCRRRLLLRYFGDAPPSDCGNCDVCLSPPATYDASDDVRKLLMAVYELGQKFGARHVIEVLRGSHGARILQFGHDRLPSFGAGANLSADEWESIVRQLIHRDILVQDVERHSVLKLTPKTRPILRDGERVDLVRTATRAKAGKASRKRGAPSIAQEEGGLFQELRALRRRLATEAQVPPYVVFSDATLRELAANKPRTLDQMLLVSGIGRHKLERYGQVFLDLIAENL
jgi:ATP-dependent DNA helicase RecQ